MTIIPNLIWDIASHSVVHKPVNQIVGLGSFMLRHGFGLLRSTLNSETVQSRILKGSTGSALIGIGSYMINRVRPDLRQSIYNTISTIFSPQNTAEAPRESLHPYELGVKAHFGQSILHHNQIDSRPKVLWLTADYDSTQALDPLQQPCGVLNRMEQRLSLFTDLKFQVVGHPEELCNAVQSGIKSGSLQTVFLSAHGNPNAIVLRTQKLISVLRSLPQGCFTGMPQNAKLFLSSCFGGYGLVPLNIAEWLAAESGITVYASQDYVYDSATSMNITQNQSKVDIDIDFCSYDEP